VCVCVCACVQHLITAAMACDGPKLASVVEYTRVCSAKSPSEYACFKPCLCAMCVCVCVYVSCVCVCVCVCLCVCVT
jgi:hypothetical protein